MALHITSPETEQLALQLARLTGTSAEKAIHTAIQHELERTEVLTPQQQTMLERIEVISRRAASRPVRDSRPADEILGSDENGLPT